MNPLEYPLGTRKRPVNKLSRESRDEPIVEGLAAAAPLWRVEGAMGAMQSRESRVESRE